MKISHPTYTVAGDIVAAVETDTPGRFGGLQTMRIVRIPAGVRYQSCRTKGVEVLHEVCFEARRPRQVAHVTTCALDRIAHHVAKINAAASVAA